MDSSFEGEKEHQYNNTNTKDDQCSQPYVKTVEPTKLGDEELPPYSVLAPETSPKRRKKHNDCSKREILELQHVKTHQKEKRDNLNCQMSTKEECVWLYNQSQIPVFVTSPTLEPIPSDPMKNISPIKHKNPNITSQLQDESNYYSKRNPSVLGKKKHFTLV